MEDRFTVGLLVENRVGVLNRIAGLYNKRGFNIESLTVGETENKAYSRMTIVSSGNEDTRKQVIRQLNKFYDVKSAILINASDTVEHVIITLKAPNGKRPQVMALFEEYGAQILTSGEENLVAEMNGIYAKTEEFIEKCRPFGITEITRSGAMAFTEGENSELSLYNNDTGDEVAV